LAVPQAELASDLDPGVNAHEALKWSAWQTLAERSYADAEKSELERFLRGLRAAFHGFDLKREETFSRMERAFFKAVWEGLSDLDSAGWKAAGRRSLAREEDLRGKGCGQKGHATSTTKRRQTFEYYGPTSLRRLAAGRFTRDRPDLCGDDFRGRAYSFVGAVSRAATASADVATERERPRRNKMREHRFLRRGRGFGSEWEAGLFSSLVCRGVGGPSWLPEMLFGPLRQ